MLNKVIIIEDDNKVQCDSVEEVVKTLIDEKYYELDEKEKLYIELYDSYNFGYNLTKGNSKKEK